MQITPNNKISEKNLDFRLKLEVQLSDAWRKNSGGRNIIQKTALVIEDKKQNPESGLDMDFEIERTSEDNPNVCTLTIWNLSQSTFNEIATRGSSETTIIYNLYYARNDNDWSLLFSGSPYFATQGNPIGGDNDAKGFLKRDEAKGGENDIPTIIYLEEGQNPIENAVISRSYQGNISTEKIIKDCADVLGFPCNIANEIIHSTVNNYVARGQVSSVLSDIVKRLNTKMDIGVPKVTYDNNNVNVFAEANGEKIIITDEKDVDVYGYSFNKDNSTRPEKEQYSIQRDDGTTGQEEVYRFTTQLLPNIGAGNKCYCEFDNVKGVRQIQKIVSYGNNYGTEGKSEVYINV